MHDFSVERFRDKETGQLVRYGGYPVLYFTKDNDTLCAECAVRLDNEYKAAQVDHKAALTDDTRWALVFARDAAPVNGDVYYEGPAVQCDECGAMITSVYGDPDEDEDEAPVAE